MMFPSNTKDGDVVFDPTAFYNRIGHLEAIRMRVMKFAFRNANDGNWPKHNPP